jgi:hypothetical protein
MYAALREARVVGLARVSSGNLNPSALMLLYVMVACRARRSHSSSTEGRTSIDQQLTVFHARRKRTSMADSMSCFNYCSAAKVDRQTPVFSAIVQGLDFFIIIVI